MLVRLWKHQKEVNGGNNCNKVRSMTMLRLKQAQLKVLVDTLRDAANVAVGALVFGQALSERGYSPTLALIGICSWALLLAFAIVLASLEDKP